MAVDTAVLEPEPIAPNAPPPAPLPSTTDEVRAGALVDVLKLLSRAQARRKRILAASAALSAAAGLIALSPPLFALAAAGSGLARPLALLALSAAAAALVWFGVWRPRREVGSLQATARLLAPLLSSPNLHRGLLPAYELGRELELKEAVDFSPALARAHIEEVARSARTADLSRALPDRAVRRAAQAFLFAALLFLFSVALMRDTMSRGARALAFGHEGPAQKLAQSAEPITGEIELTYVYPAYTRLPSRTVPNTNGEISAPKGTQVKLKTRADREVAQAFLVIGDAALPFEVQQGRTLSGSLLVSAPGSYRFRFLDKRGRKLAEGPPIPIAVEEDARPKATIVAPMSDIEVDPKARVVLRYEAEDDYGLSEVALLYKLPGASTAERILLQRPPASPRRASGEYSWDLTAPGLMAGDTIDYYLEAVDNDEVSGKKTGASKTQHLKVYSEAEHHRKIVQKIEQAWEKLVLLLADRLEGPDRKAEGRSNEKILGQSAVDTRALELAREMREIARDLRKEKSPEQLWQALDHVAAGLTEKASITANARESLALWLKRGVGVDSEPTRRLARALDAEIAEEEKDILYLEALVDQQRIEDLVALSKELSAKRRELAGLLEKYRNAPNDAMRDQLVREMARLKERMAELMQRMAELSKGVNDEHLNLEALKELNRSENLMSSFDKIQELLYQGKVEEAMKELEKLGQAIDEMEKNLQKATREAEGGEFNEVSKQLSDFARKLDQVEQGQRDLLGETQRVREHYKQAFEERLKEKGADFVERLRKKADEARQKLGAVTSSKNPYVQDEVKRARDDVEDVDKALAVKDFDQAAQSAAKALSHSQGIAEEMDREAQESKRYPPPWHKEAAEAQANARNARGAVPPLQQLTQELANLFPAPGAAMSEADQKEMKGMAQKQNQLQGQANQLRQKMDDLNKQAPLFPDEAQEMMQQASERMGRAQGQMQGKNPTGASAEERAALDQLGELKKGLSQKGGSGGGSEGSSGPKVAWPWMMPGGDQRGGGTGDQYGERDGPEAPGTDRVEIPGADKYEVPAEYRKDILDAMKQSAPDKYKDQVKRYYEEIVK